MSRKASQSSGSRLLVDPPLPGRQKWINIAIALFLASQIVTPLTYYIYKEPTNERFAWRMFSSVHMSDWTRLRITESLHRGGETLQRIVPVKDLLIESTWQALYSAQPDVRDKFLRHYLILSEADELLYEAQGIWPSGEPMETIRLAIHRRDQTIRRMDE